MPAMIGAGWLLAMALLTAGQPAEQTFSMPDDYAHPSAYGHYLTAQLLSSRGDFKRAVSELKLALAVDGNSRALTFALSDAYAKLGQWSYAKRTLADFLARFPKDNPARRRMAVLVRRERHLREAQVQWQARSSNADGR